MHDVIQTSSPRDDMEAVSWLFEQFAMLSKEAIDRPKIRRAWEEASEMHGRSGHDHWWKCLVETTRSLGLTAKVIDCSAEQMAEIATNGGSIITVLDNHWYGLAAAKRGKFWLLQPLTDQEKTIVPARRLPQIFQPPREHRQIRCIVLEPHGLSSHGSEEKGEQTPFSRFWAILQPESPDIRMIFIFSIVTGLLGLASPLAVESLVNTVAFGRLLQPIIILAVVLFGFLAFSAILEAFKIYVAEIIQRRLYARLAADLAFRIPRVQSTAWDPIDARELVNRFFEVVTVQKVAALLLLDGISLVLQVLIGMAVLAFYHPWLLGFDLILLGLIAFMILVLGRGAIQTSIKESKLKYKMAAWLENLANCPTAFRTRGAADMAIERADHLTHDYLHYRSDHFHILMRQVIFALMIYAVASTVLLGLGGFLVVSGELTLGQLVAAELIVSVIIGSFAKSGKYLESYYDVMASMDKLGNLFDLPMERHDGLMPAQIDRPAHVFVSNVGHKDPHQGQVLNNLNLDVPAGQRLMITGGEAGGSLLLDYMFGLRSPTTGHIVINSLEPEDIRPDVLRQMVSLARDVEIVSGTILENVHLERLEVSTHDARQALEVVGLIDDVLQLPDGLETVLVETGQPLTMLQRRKLMLARAIVSRPQLLLIDCLLDTLPDEEAIELTKTLSAPHQPWTLIMHTVRPALAALGTHTIHLSPKKVLTQASSASKKVE